MNERRLFLTFLFLSLFSSFSSVSIAQAPADARLVGCANIMPLGDSITVGTYGGYRNDLFTGLQQDNCGVTYVGTQYDSNTQVADKHHEGHASFSIEDVAGNVDNWIAADQPNVVVLMIGTNDVAWFAADTAEQIGARHDALISQIQKDRPGAWIFVASIPPEASALIAPNNVDRATLASQFNAVVQKNVAARASAGQNVRFVDVNAALTINDISADGVHPLQDSYSKIAQVVLQAIRTAMGSTSGGNSTPAPAASPPATSTTPSTPATPPPATPSPTPAPAPTTTATATASPTAPPPSHGGAFDLASILSIAAVALWRARKRRP